MDNREELITDLEEKLIHLSFYTPKYKKMYEILNEFCTGINLTKKKLEISLESKTINDALDIIYEDENENDNKTRELVNYFRECVVEENYNNCSLIPSPNVFNFFTKLLNDARDKMIIYKKDMTTENRKTSDEEKSYRKMIEILKDPNFSYIRMEEVIKNIKTYDEYTYRFLKLILIDNKSKYSNLLGENKKFSSCKKEDIEKLFKENNLSLNKLTPDDKNKLYKYGNLENIKKILEEKNKNGLVFFDTSLPHFVDILLLSSKNIFKKIGDILKDNSIDYKVILDNPSIFIDESNEISNIIPLYSTFINNISLLKSNNVDLYNLSKYDSNILIMDNNRLCNQILLLNKYNIDLSKIFNIKYNKDFEILRSNSIFNIIDTYIESGEEEYIKSNPYLLRNNMINVSKRIYLSKVKLNMPIYDENQKLLSSVTKGDNFIASDNELDECLTKSYANKINDNLCNTLDNDNRNYILSAIESLDIIKDIDETFKISDLTYDFDGTLISRNKFLRNMSTLINKYGISMINELIVPAMIYKSYLNEDEIEFINNEIQNLSSYARTK